MKFEQLQGSLFSTHGQTLHAPIEALFEPHLRFKFLLALVRVGGGVAWRVCTFSAIVHPEEGPKAIELRGGIVHATGRPSSDECRGGSDRAA